MSVAVLDMSVSLDGFIAGADDILIQIATADTNALRNFVVDNLSAHPAVAATETILIFEHVRPRNSASRP